MPKQDELVAAGNKAALKSKTIIGAGIAFIPSVVMMYNSFASVSGGEQVTVSQEQLQQGAETATQVIDAGLAFWTSLVAAGGAVMAAWGRFVAKDKVTMTGK